MHVRQLEFVGPLQLAHSPWHGSQVFVEEFSNTFVATQAVGQVVPSKNLPVGHDVQFEAKGPVHSAQLPSQSSQVPAPVFGNF